MSFATVWMNLDIGILSESQIDEDKYDITFMWNLKI